MSREAMLSACTINATRAVKPERRFNCKAANFAPVDRDVFTVAAEQMRDIRSFAL
jgi:predicted amidohydrolase YtcJ